MHLLHLLYISYCRSLKTMVIFFNCFIVFFSYSSSNVISSFIVHIICLNNMRVSLRFIYFSLSLWKNIFTFLKEKYFGPEFFRIFQNLSRGWQEIWVSGFTKKISKFVNYWESSIYINTSMLLKAVLFYKYRSLTVKACFNNMVIKKRDNLRNY